MTELIIVLVAMIIVAPLSYFVVDELLRGPHD